jgi:isopentenyl diphosphate isomerase/L-lactate dehydrogenase-like FMN-dependent dehydrogenase
MSETDRGNTRRQFFKFLAASPLAALAYAAVPDSWLEPLSAEMHEAERSWVPCANCGAPVYPPVDAVVDSRPIPPRYPQQVPPQMPPTQAQEEQLTGTLVSTPDAAVNVWDFEKVAHENNLPQHWDYLHLGVDDYETRVANREGYPRLSIRPRRLSGPPAAQLQTSVEILGERFDRPIFLCPVAALMAYHTQGEAGAGRAARRHNLLQVQSNVSSMSYEEIAEARGKPHWFQLYSNVDWNRNQKVIDRVAAAGCPTLVWTVDLLGGSNRELVTRTLAGQGTENALCQNCHNHQPGYQRPMARGLEGPGGERVPYNWDWVRRFKDASDMNLVIKGIVTGEEAELAIEAGVDAIYISNHGGRAENSMWATIESLPEVAAAVRGRVPIMIDSGVRRGGDIFKALALGADIVGIGRPYVWGLGAFGEDGVNKVIELLVAELSIVMRQTRVNSLAEITPEFIMQRATPIMTRHNEWGFGL